MTEETFERIYRVTGTLDDFMRDAPSSFKRNFHPEMDDTNYFFVNQIIYHQAIAYVNEGYDELRKFAFDNYRLKLHPSNKNLDHLNDGFLANAGDSLLTRMYDDPEFQAEMKIILDCNGKGMHLKVEDNGTGIDPEVEPLLFSTEIRSKKKTIHYGKRGNHLFEIKKIIDWFKGTIHFQNKGPNQGAIFWYQIPLKALKW